MSGVVFEKHFPYTQYRHDKVSFASHAGRTVLENRIMFAQWATSTTICHGSRSNLLPSAQVEPRVQRRNPELEVILGVSRN